MKNLDLLLELKQVALNDNQINSINDLLSFYNVGSAFTRLDRKAYTTINTSKGSTFNLDSDIIYRHAQHIIYKNLFFFQTIFELKALLVEKDKTIKELEAQLYAVGETYKSKRYSDGFEVNTTFKATNEDDWLFGEGFNAPFEDNSEKDTWDDDVNTDNKFTGGFGLGFGSGFNNDIWREDNSEKDIWDDDVNTSNEFSGVEDDFETGFDSGLSNDNYYNEEPSISTTNFGDGTCDPNEIKACGVTNCSGCTDCEDEDDTEWTECIDSISCTNKDDNCRNKECYAGFSMKEIEEINKHSIPCDEDESSEDDFESSATLDDEDLSDDEDSSSLDTNTEYLYNENEDDTPLEKELDTEQRIEIVNSEDTTTMEKIEIEKLDI